MGSKMTFEKSDVVKFVKTYEYYCSMNEETVVTGEEDIGKVFIIFRINEDPTTYHLSNLYYPKHPVLGFVPASSLEIYKGSIEAFRTTDGKLFQDVHKGANHQAVIDTKAELAELLQPQVIYGQIKPEDAVTILLEHKEDVQYILNKRRSYEGQFGPIHAKNELRAPTPF